jgi:hypothetical protein
MTTITVTIWHNVAVDGQGRHTGMLEGYRPGDPMVRVFTYQADPAGPEEIAEEAFAFCDDHPCDASGQDLGRRYYERELRSVSFPGDSSCCSGSCCIHRWIVWPGSPSRWSAERTSRQISRTQGGSTDDGQDLAAADTAARPARTVRRG